MSGPVLAAIDCGTNSTRLLVGEAGPQGVTTLERINTITRLGQGVDATGRLAPEAVERTLSALREYRQVMDRLGVQQVRMTATSAARDAENRDEFFGPAEQIAGTRPELLSGEEEGRLTFAGATADLDPADGPFAIVDIGGGSTEFIVGRTEPEGVISIDVGCVRLTERFLEHDPARPEELLSAISVVEAYLDDVVQAIPEIGSVGRFVGVAGTITTVAAVELGLQTYDRDAIHHFELTRAAAEDVFRTLATEDREQRLTNPGLEAARADVIVGGCCALVAIMRTFGVDPLLVSEADILDGLLASLA